MTAFAALLAIALAFVVVLLLVASQLPKVPNGPVLVLETGPPLHAGLDVTLLMTGMTKTGRVHTATGPPAHKQHMTNSGLNGSGALPA